MAFPKPETTIKPDNTSENSQNSGTSAGANNGNNGGNNGFNTAKNPDLKEGTVDLRDLIKEYAMDVDDDGPDTSRQNINHESAKKTDNNSQNKTGNADPEKPGSNDEVKVGADEFLDGEIVFETIDFAAVMALCAWADEEDEDKYNVKPSRKARLIKLWDKQLKAINYKVPIWLALVIVSGMSYAPLVKDAYDDRKINRKKKKEKQAEAAGVNVPDFSMKNQGVYIKKVDIPPPITMKQPTKGTQGRRTSQEQAWYEYAEAIKKREAELEARLKEVNEKMTYEES